MDSTADPEQPILTASYEIEQFDTENILTFNVQDLRSHQTTTDFELSVTTPSVEKIAVAISCGQIADFVAAPGNGDPGRFGRETISDFAAEYTNNPEKSLTHSLALSFAYLLPILLEYCAKVPDYEMGSIDPDTGHFELTFE